MRKLALITALLLAGCGDDAPDRAATEPDPTATATATVSPDPTPEAIDPLEEGGIEPVQGLPAGKGTALLTAVRVARHEGYDRVVFQFDRALPGFEVGYAEGPVRADGSGDVVKLDGEHALVVRMEPALDADLEKEGAPLTYTGPQRFSPDTPVVAELARVGGFEGVLTWAIGVRDRTRFRVDTLGGPHRLVVDVGNH